jgi:hypothetical protein
MRIFFYKFLIIIVGLFFLYQFTVGFSISKIQQEIFSLSTKENSLFIQNKIRKEIKNSLKKDRILSEEDSVLLNSFLQKIKSDLESSK